MNPATGITAGFTVINPVFVSVSESMALVAVNITSNVPAVLYVIIGFFLSKENKSALEFFPPVFLAYERPNLFSKTYLIFIVGF